LKILLKYSAVLALSSLIIAGTYAANSDTETENSQEEIFENSNDENTSDESLEDSSDESSEDADESSEDSDNGVVVPKGYKNKRDDFEKMDSISLFNLLKTNETNKRFKKDQKIVKK
jgi:predicted ribosomally synthesized peptide with SipW-like signal peptide